MAHIDSLFSFFFFQAEDGIRDVAVTGVQTCALPISFSTLPPKVWVIYGMQWITHTLGGKVERAERREYGRAQLKVDCEGGSESSALFAGVPTALRVWNSHGDHVRSLPEGFRTIGKTENAIAAVENPKQKI